MIKNIHAERYISLSKRFVSLTSLCVIHVVPEKPFYIAKIKPKWKQIKQEIFKERYINKQRENEITVIFCHVKICFIVHHFLT